MAQFVGKIKLVYGNKLICQLKINIRDEFTNLLFHIRQGEGIQ